MRKFLLFPVILVLGILQSVIFSRFKIFNAGPDLLLVSAVLAGIFFGPKWALPLALFAGAFKDALSVGAFGINTLLFVSWGFLAVKLSRKIVIDDNFRAAVVVLIIGLFNNLLRGLVHIYLGNPLPPGIYFRIVFIESVYTALFTPILFTLFLRAGP